MRHTSALLAPRRCGLGRGAHLPNEPMREPGRGSWSAAVVVVSMCVMSAGRGYRYLLKSVAAGDGDSGCART